MQTDTMIHQSEALSQARIDIARLEAVVASQGANIARLEVAVMHLSKTVQSMRDDMSEAKGGWRTLMWIGSGCATLGAVFAWVIDHLIKRIP